jgi:hypothetical protein
LRDSKKYCGTATTLIFHNASSACAMLQAILFARIRKVIFQTRIAA